MVNKNYKVAIAHDWLVTYAGAETVLEHIIHLFDQLDLFCIVKDVKNPIFLNSNVKEVHTSFLQAVPFVKKKLQISC